jgi:hypothetical protein
MMGMLQHEGCMNGKDTPAGLKKRTAASNYFKITDELLVVVNALIK